MDSLILMVSPFLSFIFSNTMMLKLIFFNCPLFVVYIKIIKTMVRELMQMNLALALLVNINQV